MFLKWRQTARALGQAREAADAQLQFFAAAELPAGYRMEATACEAGSVDVALYFGGGRVSPEAETEIGTMVLLPQADSKARRRWQLLVLDAPPLESEHFPVHRALSRQAAHIFQATSSVYLPGR